MKEIKIGDQIWSASNLNVDKFQNGDLVPQALDEEDWINAGINKKPCWCYYEEDSNNGEKFGKLYNWFAVNDPRGIAPVGFHVPTIGEWKILSDYLGGDSIAGQKMKSNYGWKNNGNGTNSIGFKGLAGGLRYSFGNFSAVGAHCYWWSSSEGNTAGNTASAWYRDLGCTNGIAVRNLTNKKKGFSVRCLRD